jgi:hypothetical protein
MARPNWLQFQVVSTEQIYFLIFRPGKIPWSWDRFTIS